MFNEVVTDTNIVYYLMIAVGVVGVLAKAVNQITLRRLVRAAGNMSKSTHRLIKLVRAKYEHALMLHDRVENAEAFVEKYIYEYRGFLLRIHTWRQLELQSIWFSGILAAFGGIIWYVESGFCEEMYRYISLGAAEMVLLFVISQISDEQYKIEAGKNYMVDYLENVCAMRRRKARQSEKEQINVIQPESTQALRANGREMDENAAGREAAAGNGSVKGKKFSAGNRGTAGKKRAYGKQSAEAKGAAEGSGLSISIEGEPRKAGTGLSGDAASMYEAEALALSEENAEDAFDYGETAGEEGSTGYAAAGREGNGMDYAGREGNGMGYAGREESSMGYAGREESGMGYAGREGSSMSYAAGREGSAMSYAEAAGKQRGGSGYGEAAVGYGAAAGRGVSASGQNAGGTQMKRIPGRFQDVVQRMIEDTAEYEEVLEGPALPEEAPYSAGRPDRLRADRENIPDKMHQAAEYMESGASYEDGDEDGLKEYDRVRRKNRKKGDATRQVIRRTIKGNGEPSEREESNLKEEAIRQILEEFLA